MGVCAVRVRAGVHEVKVYHRSGTFNNHSSLAIGETQIDKHLVWQIGKGFPKTY